MVVIRKYLILLLDFSVFPKFRTANVLFYISEKHALSISYSNHKCWRRDYTCNNVSGTALSCSLKVERQTARCPQSIR